MMDNQPKTEKGYFSRGTKYEDCEIISRELETLIVENEFVKACFKEIVRVTTCVFRLFLKSPLIIEGIRVYAISFVCRVESNACFITRSVKEEICINVGFLRKDSRLIEVENSKYFADTKSFELHEFDSQTKITFQLKEIISLDDVQQNIKKCFEASRELLIRLDNDFVGKDKFILEAYRGEFIEINSLDPEDNTNMMNFKNSRLRLLLKVPILLDGHMVHAISLIFPLFYEEISIERAYFEENRMIQDEESVYFNDVVRFDQNVSIEKLIEDIQRDNVSGDQMKSEEKRITALEEIKTLLGENALVKNYFDPIEVKYDSLSFELVYKQSKPHDYNVHAIEFQIPLHHLEIFINVRKVWKNGRLDSFRRYETHEFASNTEITKIMLSLR